MNNQEKFLQSIHKDFLPNELSYFKVYRDLGGHFVATSCSRHTEFAKRKRDTVISDKRVLLIRDKLEQLVKEGKKKDEIKSQMLEELINNFPDDDSNELSDVLDDEHKRIYHNLYMRKKRFRRKAFLYDWNYFCTFTYDNDKINEENFKLRLRKCLSNLHSRKGWKIIGMWERGEEKERLHLHALIQVPPGMMVGRLYKDKSYSKKQKKVVITQLSDYFGERFGRTEFKDINENILLDAVNYITKYMGKSDMPVVYSRQTNSEIYTVLDPNADLILSYKSNAYIKSICNEGIITKQEINNYTSIYGENVRESLKIYREEPLKAKYAEEEVHRRRLRYLLLIPYLQRTMQPDEFSKFLVDNEYLGLL